jgi:phosphoserine phosphatase
MIAKNCFSVLVLLVVASAAIAADPLPSWNDGAAKKALIDFVEKVTKEGSPDYVPPDKRIATFDNDGCLWAEQPMYFQGIFLLDRVKAMAADHPEWQDTEPFKSVLANDMKGVMASGMDGLKKLASATHADITAEEFDTAVSQWLATEKHPKFNRPYNELVYQPQLELLRFLRDNGFKTFIVSGGGIDFMRVFAEKTYGIPPEQVVGTSTDAKYELRDGKPVIVKQASGMFIDDKAGKPVGIHTHIGRRPIIAVGNSDGDFEMLEYTTSGKGARLGVIIHHTDAEREFAYDRDSHVGKLARGLDEGPNRGWIIVDMKKDWRSIFPTSSKRED